MKAHMLFLLALCVAAFAASPANAALYKWVDDNGRVVYGDQPPPGVKVERLNAPAPPTNPHAVREVASKDAEIKQRQQQRAEEETKATKARAEAKRKSDGCSEARGRIKTLKEDMNVFRYNEKGEKVFLDTSARQSAIADNEKLLRDLNCPPPPS